MRMGTGRWAQKGEISAVPPAPQKHIPASGRPLCCLRKLVPPPISWPTGEAEAGHTSDRGGENGTRGGS